MTTCSMSVNLEQTDGAGTVELAPLPHPGRSTVRDLSCSRSAPILNSSRRVTLLEGMGSCVPFFSLLWIREADPPLATSNVRRSCDESSPLQNAGLSDSCR